MRKVATLLLIVTVAVQAGAGKRKSMGTLFRKADQKVEIGNAVASLGAAHRKCENYAWAAIVEAMMRAQKVPIGQDDWAVRTSDGMKCFPSLDDYAQRAQALNGDYTLNDGSKISIHTEYSGLPQPDVMIYSLRIGRPLLIVWNGRPYMLYGLLYDELIHTSFKSKEYIIREMRLLDAALPVAAPKRLITIKKVEGGDDQLAQVTGVMSVNVNPRNFYDIPSERH